MGPGCLGSGQAQAPGHLVEGVPQFSRDLIPGPPSSPGSAQQPPGVQSRHPQVLRSVWEPWSDVGATAPPCLARLVQAHACTHTQPQLQSLPRTKMGVPENPPHLHLHEGAPVEAASSGRQRAPQAAALGHDATGRAGPGLGWPGQGGSGRQGQGSGCGTDRLGRHRLRVPLGSAITSSPGQGRSGEAEQGDPTLRPGGRRGSLFLPLPAPCAPSPACTPAASLGVGEGCQGGLRVASGVCRLSKDLQGWAWGSPEPLGFGPSPPPAPFADPPQPSPRETRHET